MLKSVLGSRVKPAINLAKKVGKAHNRTIKDIECIQDLEPTEFGEEITLKVGSNCFISNFGFVILGASGVKISTVQEDGTQTTPKENAFGALPAEGEELENEETFYVLEPQIEQKVYYFPFSTSSRTIEWDNYVETSKKYMVLQKSFTSSVISDYEVKSDGKIINEDSTIVFINPNGASISVENEKNSNATLYDFMSEDEVKLPASNSYAGYVTTEPTNAPDDDEIENITSGSWYSRSKVTIKGKDGSIKLPEKVFELIPGSIFNEDTPSPTFPAGKLTGGNPDNNSGPKTSTIVIIVVVCVVVVAIIAICIYCFACRNKSDSDAPEP